MKPGIYKDIDIDKYHSEKEFLSSTGLKRAKKSLKDFQLYQSGYYDNQKKMHFDFGNAFEMALLEPDKFKEGVSIFDPFERPEKDKGITSKKNQSWKNDIFSSNKYVINKEGLNSFQVLEEMLKSCYQDAVIQRLIKNIEYQNSIYWIDQKTGLKLKTRPDICKSKKNIVVDVKTADDGSPEKFSKDLANFDYPFQACMQIDGVIESGLMQKVDNYFWLVVEKKPPFSATLYEFDQEDINWCMNEYEYTLKCVADAIEQNKFPSYSFRADNKFGILTANLPLWYRNYGY
jgi:exodeoxyribonuclease VIII